MCSGFSQARNGVSSRKHSTLLYFSHSHVRWKITLVDVVKRDMSIMELTKSMTLGRDWFVEGQYPTQPNFLRLKVSLLYMLHGK